MKRITMIFIATLALTLLVYAQSRTPQVTSPASVTSQVAALPKPCLYFGKAKKGCGGWGICKIGFCAAGGASRSVGVDLKVVGGGKLELRLLKRVPEEEPVLSVDEDIQLSAEIAKQLGVKNATIRKGEYAFSASKSVLNARFTK